MTIYCQLSKLSSFSPFLGFRGKIAFLRHLVGFFEKSEESRPPLKLKSNWGQFFNFSLGCFFQKIQFPRGLGHNAKILKNTFWNCHFIWSSKICITPLSYLFF